MERRFAPSAPSARDVEQKALAATRRVLAGRSAVATMPLPATQPAAAMRIARSAK
jgi:hypothetical protein